MKLQKIKLQKKSALFVPGGGLIQDKKTKRWRTTGFDEPGDTFGTIGDRIRVVAAAYLYKENPESLVIASGSRGQFKNIPQVPTLAEVLKNELIEQGVPKENIVKEDQGGSTYRQLVELKAMIKKHALKRVSIVSNDWHLPRIRAMVEYKDDLKELEQLSKIEYISAEEIVVEHDESQWRHVVDSAYKTDAIQQRIAKELKGVKDIREGKYRYEG